MMELSIGRIDAQPMMISTGSFCIGMRTRFLSVPPGKREPICNLFSHNMFFTGFFGSPICKLQQLFFPIGLLVGADDAGLVAGHASG